jgi:formylglycine-generating enzyme required for sulfatase activity/serine/threonine protein kinase
MSVATGDQVGPYRLEELIGKGAFGVVFRARAEENADVPRGSVVALKVLHDVHKDDARIVQRFHKEARLAVKLSHPHVVRVFGEGVHKGEHYIVMELAEGQSLTEYLRQAGIAPPETKTSRKAKAEKDTVGQADRATGGGEPPILNLPIPEAVEILRQVASVLQAAGDIGLVHRDIKPDNILVSRDKAGKLQTKVLDFGLAKDLLSHSMSFTSIGKGIGTPPFMAPEQFEGTTTDIRSDLYSLGATAYQMLTGRPPFPGPTLSAYMRQHQEDIPSAPCRLNPNVPENLSQVVERLLAKKPSDRHQKPAELVEDLNRVERGEVPLKRYKPRKARKHSLAFTVAAIAAGALIALGLVAGYLYYRSSNAEGRIAEAVSQARYLAEQGKLDESLAMLDQTIGRWQATRSDLLTDAQSAREEVRKAKLAHDEQERKAKLAQEERERKAREADIAARADKARKHEAEGDRLLLAKDYTQAIAQFEAALAYAPSEVLKQKVATATRLKREADDEEARKIAEARFKAEQEDARKRDEERRVQDYRAAFRNAEKLLGDEDRLDEALKSIETALDLAHTPGEKADATILKGKILVALDKRRVLAAVVDFSVDKSVRDDTLSGKAIAVMLEQEVSSRYRLVTRDKIEKALRELDFGITDLADPKKAQKFGKMVSAQYLITGDAVQLGPVITIAATILSVETGQIRQTASIAGKNVGEFNALFPELSRILAMTNEEKQKYLDEQRNYPKWLAEGKDLMQQGKWPEAVKAFENAQRAKATAEVVALLANAREKAEEQRILAERKAQHEAALAEGQRLLGERKWAEAEAAFRKGLAIPGYDASPQAQDGIKSAQAGADEEKRKAEYDRAVAAAKAALDKNDFETVAKEVQTALNQIPDGAEAKELLAKLEPTLTIVAEVGGVEYKGAQISIGAAVRQETTPATYRLEKGKTYEIEVTIPNQGEKYYTKATKTVSVDWNGPQTFRAVIRQEERPRLQVYKEWPFAAAEAKRRQEETARALGLKAVEEDVDLGNGVKLTLVLIPAGEFVMGSTEEQIKAVLAFDKNCKEELLTPEKPAHRVTIPKPFWMGKHEVTQEQWEVVVGSKPSKFKGAKNPVEQVSWNDIQGFLQKLNARAKGGEFALPTEAQWEYACRAGSDGHFCFGNDWAKLGDYSWCGTYTGGNSKDTTNPVGQKQPSAWGLYDVHGNVWEWCASPWAREYNGSEQKGADAQGESRVFRGGTWVHSPSHLRSASRFWGSPDLRDLLIGFRTVRLAAGP